MNRIDVHSHLLPGVDDGCASLEESLACARMLLAGGYSRCICTPHAWANHPDVTRARLPIVVAELQRALDKHEIAIRLFPGGELNLTEKVFDRGRSDFIELNNDSGWLLFDLWAERLPKWFDKAIAHLRSLGLRPILAHPERMRAVQDDPALADHFAELQLPLQGNLQCFSDRPGADTRQVAERYLIEGRYFLLGSDTHNPAGLVARLAGLRNAIALVGSEAVDRLTIENPRELIIQ